MVLFHISDLALRLFKVVISRAPTKPVVATGPQAARPVGPSLGRALFADAQSD